MVEQSEVLDDIAPLVEAHHERVDGAGYPNGLSGDELPLAACIISVCDAFDAIAHTRQYREGAGWERALDVLAEHAGTQWRTDVVRAATKVIRADNEIGNTDALARVGRPTAGDANACHCADALPSTVVRELERVA